MRTSLCLNVKGSMFNVECYVSALFYAWHRVMSLVKNTPYV